jgi:EpsD family peptidyl-prolyl cis-trans isomerase
MRIRVNAKRGTSLKPFLAITAIILALASLGACSQRDATVPGQVLARVNDKEVTVHQLNYLMADAGEQSAADKQRVLDKLVDQEVLVQRAAALKLDHDPYVLQAIEFARRQVLAQAVISREITRPADPTRTQINEFYDKNPALFSARKSFDVDIFSVKQNSMNAQLQSILNQSKNAGDTEKILQASHVRYELGEGKRSTEQLPVGFREKIESIKPGDIVMYPDGDSMMLLQIRGSTPAPIALDDATPIIKEYMQDDESKRAVAERIKLLRGAAKVNVLHPFVTDTEPAAPGKPMADVEASRESGANATKGLN